MSYIDHVVSVARRKLGGDERLTWCELRAVGPIGGPRDVQLKMGIPRVYTRGTLKGELKWAGIRLQKVFVSETEALEEAARYERQDGKCSECLGEGRVVQSCGVGQETTYRSCGRCSGTGLPPETPAVIIPPDYSKKQLNLFDPNRLC